MDYQGGNTMKAVFTSLILFFSILFIQNSNSQSITWSEQTSGSVNQLTSVSAINANNVWVCGYLGTILRTTNGGTNWLNAAVAPIPTTLDLHSIFGIDSMTALVAGSGTAGSFMFRTSNGGANWTQVFSETGGFINSVQMGNNFAGFMMGDPVGGRWSLWGTTDAGITWDSSTFYLQQQAAEAGWNNSMFFDINTGLTFGTNNTKVYKTLNLVNWLPQTTTGQANTYSIWFNSPTNGMTGGTGLLFTTTGGIIWTPTSAVLPGTGNLAAISGTGTIYVAARQTTAIYLTSNNGGTWVTSYTAPAGNYRHISKDRVTGGVYYGVRTNGGISKGVFMVGISPISTQTPDNYVLEQNYPNPFNPSTNIKFNIPKAGMVKLVVYDGIGREVKTIVNENLNAGEYEVAFESLNLTSGAYYYKLAVNDFVETKKMILVK